MGWRGVLRSIEASSRAAERNARRRQRELEKQEKEYAKMQELERAAYEVELYENRLDLLVSLHKERMDSVNWRGLALAPAPAPPTRSDAREAQARLAYKDYKPGIVDRLFRREAHKREKLAAAIETARRADEGAYQRALRTHSSERSEWEQTRSLAQRVLSGDAEARAEALDRLDPFHELRGFGSRLTFRLTGDIPDATVHVAGEAAVPKETKSLLKTGRLSVKPMPKVRFFELYQDHVCSAVLRVASGLLAVLPVDMVIVTAVSELLNSRTGHLEETPILSVAVPRNTLDKLNLGRLDPSDSMSNFIHRMDFKRTKGFAAVESIKRAELGADQA
jgi:hypothetical protein